MRTFFIVLLLASFFWAAFCGYHLLTHQAQYLTPAHQAALNIIGLITITASLILAAAIRSTSRRHTHSAITHRRLDLYENFILLWHSIQSIEDVEKISSLQLQADELKSSMALVASAEVLCNLNRLLDQAAQGGPQSAQKIYEELLLSMRRDLHLPVLYPLPKELNKLFANLHNDR